MNVCFKSVSTHNNIVVQKSKKQNNTPSFPAFKGKEGVSSKVQNFVSIPGLRIMHNVKTVLKIIGLSLTLLPVLFITEKEPPNKLDMNE